MTPTAKKRADECVVTMLKAPCKSAVVIASFIEAAYADGLRAGREESAEMQAALEWADGMNDCEGCKDGGATPHNPLCLAVHHLAIRRNSTPEAP